MSKMAQTIAEQRRSFAVVSAGLQRRCDRCKKKRQMIQRSPASRSCLSGVPYIVNEVLKSPGRSLDIETKALMESQFGHDFSKVRIHDDAQAARSASLMRSRAYTMKNDIVFDEGLYSPKSNSGKQLLAHELSHFIQQSTATEADRVDHGRPIEIDPSSRLELEAEETARKIDLNPLAKPPPAQKLRIVADLNRYCRGSLLSSSLWKL